MAHHLSDRPQMTFRGRAYLAATSVTHWCLATALVVAPGMFMSPSFDTIKAISYGQLQPWAWFFALVAGLALFATISGQETAARVALTLSAMVTGFWFVSFLIGLVVGASGGPTAPIVWGALVVKDTIVGIYPLTSPLEPLLRRVASTPT